MRVYGLLTLTMTMDIIFSYMYASYLSVPRNKHASIKPPRIIASG